MSDTALTTLGSKRIPLIGLRSDMFQHPLDRQATQNLKKLKGFDWLAKKFLEFGIERIEYVRHIGAGIRVGPRQMTKHYQMLRECCRILDMDEPELYVMQGGVNAYTSGHTHPFIVMETGLLELMTDDEEMAIIAHELGHIKCGHVLYKTMARGIKPLLEMVGKLTMNIGALVGASIETGLAAWNRRSELSADRAALLGMQDPRPCIQMLMNLAGGTVRHVEHLDTEQFLNQARAYQEGMDSTMTDRFYRFMANMGASHPFAVERARALDEWSRGQEYHDILAGKYRNLAPVLANSASCPNCREFVPPGTMFCGGCGTPIRTR